MQFEDKIFFALTLNSHVRKWSIGIIKHKYFDSFILFVILLNSIVLAIPNYSVVDSTGNLIEGNSWRNILANRSEIYFTCIFGVEFILKAFSYGLFGKRGYFSDTWNWLDFIVVISGFLSIIPSIPSVSILRTFRVLRPLRSISSNPGLATLVVAILQSIPQLMGVLAVLMFLFLLFGVISLQIFSGPLMHTRCRITPYPVLLSWQEGLPYEDYRCLNASNFDTIGQTNILKKNSPWYHPQDCYWPADESNNRFCSFDNAGINKCYHDVSVVPEEAWRWCGSNYDALGNKRFKTSHIMHEDERIVDLNYGFTVFDNIGDAFLTIFQVVTREGWSDIMYHTQDIMHPLVGGVLFSILIILGGFFVLNLLLAVLEDNFEHIPPVTSSNENELSIIKEYIGNIIEYLDSNIFNRFVYPSSFESTRIELENILNSNIFSSFIIFLIVANTLVLAMDHYPIESDFELTLETINAILVLIFTTEMILKLFCYGPKKYISDPSNAFDGVIVVFSIVDLATSPPVLFYGFSNSASHGGSTDGGGVSALRSFRLFRVFKLIVKWKSMKLLITRVFKTLIDLANFGILLFLFLYIYTLFGLQFFSNRFRFNDDGYSIKTIHSMEWYDAKGDDRPRSNFDDFSHAFASVFQILSTENWNIVMYDTRRSGGILAIFFPCSLIIIGNYIFMNLFLAILLGNFASREKEMRHLLNEKKVEQQGSSGTHAVKSSLFSIAIRAKQIASLKKLNAVIPLDLEPSSALVVPVASDIAESVKNKVDNDKTCDYAAGDTVHGNISETNRQDDVKKSTIELTKSNLSKIEESHAYSGQTSSKIDIGKAGDRGSVAEEGIEKNKTSEDIDLEEDVDESKYGANIGNTLFVFSPTNPFREWCYHLMNHGYFDSFVLLLIAISSITLGIDSPLNDPKSSLAISIHFIDMFLTAAFTLEMCIKLIALGAFSHPTSYMRNSWNILDFIIVVISIMSVFSVDSLKALRSLRSLRCLRPLRAISRAPGLKLVINTIFACINDVMNVASLCFLFLIIFSIFGVSYFKGAMKGCHGEVFDDIIFPNDEYFDLLAYPKQWSELSETQKTWFGESSPVTNLSCTGFDYPNEPCCSDFPVTGVTVSSRMICTCWGGTWEYVMHQNFDNILTSLLSFFGMSTSEGWVDLMYAMVDARGIDLQPVRDAHIEWVFFCIFFMLVGSFLSLNLFVGVIIDNFNKCKTKMEGLSFLTPDQQEWVKTQEVLRFIKPFKKFVKPKGRISAAMFDITFSPLFDYFIMWCIIINTIIIGMNYFGQSDLYRQILEATNVLFALVFTMEALIKFIGLKERYFESLWNIFDFVVVLGTNVGILVTTFGGSSVGSVVSVLRAFRIARITKLLSNAEAVNQLFNTLLKTLPGLANIAVLLLLIFYIFAVMGVQLFATVQYIDSYNEYANFRDFGTAMISLLRFATGENWNKFMYDASSTPAGCVESPAYDPSYCGFSNHLGCIPLNGCGSYIIFPYMILFMLIVSFVFINLFIGVILEGFQTADDSHKAIKPEDIERFTDRWSIYDPLATCFISVNDLEDFVQTLFQPLGFGGYLSSHREVRQRIVDLNLPIYHGHKVHFKDCLFGLSTDFMRRANTAKGIHEELILLPVQGFTENLDHSDKDLTKPIHLGRKRTGFIADKAGMISERYYLKHYYAVKTIKALVPELIERVRRQKEILKLDEAASALVIAAATGDLVKAKSLTISDQKPKYKRSFSRDSQLPPDILKTTIMKASIRSFSKQISTNLDENIINFKSFQRSYSAAGAKIFRDEDFLYHSPREAFTPRYNTQQSVEDSLSLTGLFTPRDKEEECAQPDSRRNSTSLRDSRDDSKCVETEDNLVFLSKQVASPRFNKSQIVPLETLVNYISPRDNVKQPSPQSINKFSLLENKEALSNKDEKYFATTPQLLGHSSTVIFTPKRHRVKLLRLVTCEINPTNLEEGYSRSQSFDKSSKIHVETSNTFYNPSSLKRSQVALSPLPVKVNIPTE